jgi:hypothetical protein
MQLPFSLVFRINRVFTSDEVFYFLQTEQGEGEGGKLHRCATSSRAAATSSSRARRHSSSQNFSVTGHIPTGSATSQCLLIHPTVRQSHFYPEVARCSSLSILSVQASVRLIDVLVLIC